MILNIILIILLVKLFLEYKFNLNPYTTLNCGIFGYYGKSSRKFSWLKFDLLGIDNDKRGGDACGRVIGNTVEHSNDYGKKRYNDYISTYLPPKAKVKDKLIIGHTRKASYGAGKSGVEYTQPLPFYNKDGGIDFVFAHNGTLYNHDDLAKEYGIDKEEFLYYDKEGDLEPINGKMNDSQILGWILGYNKDFDVLEKYKGGAAFALYDYRDDLLYLWSGASLRSNATLPAEERPLNILQGKDHLWFGSLQESLRFINYEEDDEVEELENNVLYTFKDGVEIDRKFIDRTKSYQFNKVEYTPSKSPTYVPARTNNSNSSSYPKNYDDYVECSICNGSGLLQGQYECFHCFGMGYVSQEKRNKHNINLKELACAYKDQEREDGTLWGEKLPLKNSMIIHFLEGRYFYQQKECHGIFHINEIGMIEEKPVIPERPAEHWKCTKPYYFVKGAMVDNHQAFMKFARKVKKDSTMTREDYIALRRESRHPVYSKEEKLVIRGTFDKKTGWHFSGKFTPLFSCFEYTIEKGKFESRIREQSGQAQPIHYENNELPIQEADIVPEGNDCTTCQGFGILKSGDKCPDCDEVAETIPEMKCVFCDGTGIDKDSETCICQEETTASYSEAELDFYEEQVKKSLSEELATLLKKAEEARYAGFDFAGHKITESYDSVIGDIIQVLEDVKL